VRAVALASVLASTGCTAIFGLEEPVRRADAAVVGVDAPAVDARIADAPDATSCYGTGPYTLCLAAPPTGLVQLGGTLDTASDGRCLASESAACVIVGSDIVVTPSALRAVGTRPLVLLAANALDISGELDVGSRVLFNGTTPTGVEIGAGAAPAAMCPTPSTANNAGGGAGGAAGGSFGSKGGTGGRGGADASQAEAGASISLPAELRGGCAGARGGDATANTGGPGGPGGGYVLLIGDSIAINAPITAGGAGGLGGLDAHAGGGGGGTGGVIGIDAAAVMCAGEGRVLANGGGGGEGGGLISSGGGAGAAATSVASPAAGGDGNNMYGGNGGGGSYNGSAGSPGQAGQQQGGGGGGGGGAGFIKVFRGGVPSGCPTSPPPL